MCSALGVRQEDVVVGAEQPDRSVGVPVDVRRPGDVVPPSAVLALHHLELVGHRREHRAEPRHARPRRHVGRARRTERPQVAPDQLAHVHLGGRSAEVVLDGLVDDAARPLPQSPRRHLDQRDPLASRVDQRLRGHAGEGLRQPLFERLDRQRARGQQPPRDLGQRGRGHVPCGPADLVAHAHLVERRLDPGPQRQRVVGDEHVDGAAHGEEPDGLAGPDGVRQLRAGRSPRSAPRARGTAAGSPGPAGRPGARPSPGPASRSARAGAAARAACGSGRGGRAPCQASHPLARPHSKWAAKVGWSDRGIPRRRELSVISR